MFPKQNMKKAAVKKKKVVTNVETEIVTNNENDEPFEHVDERPGHLNHDLNVASNNYMNL